MTIAICWPSSFTHRPGRFLVGKRYGVKDPLTEKWFGQDSGDVRQYGQDDGCQVVRGRVEDYSFYVDFRKSGGVW